MYHYLLLLTAKAAKGSLTHTYVQEFLKKKQPQTQLQIQPCTRFSTPAAEKRFISNEICRCAIHLFQLSHMHFETTISRRNTSTILRLSVL